jgi:transposase-like protein
MKKSKSLYHGHRFPAAVISCAVRWYFRYQLSLRDIDNWLRVSTSQRNRLEALTRIGLSEAGRIG